VLSVDDIMWCIRTPFRKCNTTRYGKAIIYVYRLWSISGCGNDWYLSVNGLRLTIVTNGGYFPVLVNPGNITFSVCLCPAVWNAFILLFLPSYSERITIHVKPNKSYFVRFHSLGSMEPGHYGPRT